MTFFDVYSLIMLFTFFTLLVSKSWLTHKRERTVFALGQGKKGPGAVLEYFYYFGFVFLVYLVTISALGLPLVWIGELIVLLDHLFFKIIGVIIQTISIILFSFALASFKDAWRIGVATQTPGRLITTGIFKYTRNPTYIAMSFLFFGFFLTYSNFFFLGSAFFLPLSFHYQIKQEERLLTSLYKDDYLYYLARTPRYWSLRRGFKQSN